MTKFRVHMWLDFVELSQHSALNYAQRYIAFRKRFPLAREWDWWSFDLTVQATIPDTAAYAQLASALNTRIYNDCKQQLGTDQQGEPIPDASITGIAAFAASIWVPGTGGRHEIRPGTPVTLKRAADDEAWIFEADVPCGMLAACHFTEEVVQ